MRTYNRLQIIIVEDIVEIDKVVNLDDNKKTLIIIIINILKMITRVL